MSASKSETIKVHFELSETDLDFFKKRLDKARDGRKADESEILDSVAAMKTEACASNPPAFVTERLELLDPLVGMVRDEDWKLSGEGRARVLDALAYFAEPDDLIPDRIPGIGYIDDAIMIEIVASMLTPELDAYAEFCAHREDLKTGGDDLPSLEDARKVMQSRMRRRRGRARAGGFFHAAVRTHF